VAVSSGDPYAQAHDRDVLANAIATLPPDHRIVVALRYYRDLPIETIATRLDIPAGTVQSRLHYALKRLHAAIGAADGKGTDR
jgi:RNA polymerase sigma-70 factor, ECF subfamily